MSDAIKLKLAGEKVTLDVVKAGELPFGRRPEIEFVGRDGTKVWVPKPSVERQLARVNLTLDSVVGRRVTIGRSASSDPAKPYWDVLVEGAVSEAKQNGSGGPASAGAAGVGHQAVASTGKLLDAPATTPVPPPGNLRGASSHAEHVARATDGQQSTAAHSDRLYTKIASYYCDEIIPLLKRAGVAVTHEGTSAAIAAIYIAATNKH